MVYTVSDFSSSSIDCVDLLFFSINKNNLSEYDFFIISNKDKPPDLKYNFIKSEFQDLHIVFSKYSNYIPEGYDIYIYFDSDILFFGDLNELFSLNKDISIVEEDYNKMSYNWFCYPYATEEEKESFVDLQGLNAGQFVFKDKIFLDHIRKNFENNMVLRDNNEHQVAFEQSCFNYAIYKKYRDNCYFLNGITSLFAHNNPICKEKKLYHFCGFTNQMDSKYERMSEFYNKYLLSRK